MYPIEIKMASKNAWFTPQESNNYYGTRYAREGVTVHWWGDGTGADNHDNIVNYFLSQAEQGVKSVNYVVSDNKITLMVSPDNVAWCSGSGNPTTVSIEHQPTLGAEGYKKSGWLIWQLEERFGHQLSIYPHNKWQQTACPGSINLDKIAQEVNRWRTGYYDPKPMPTPVPAPDPAPTLQLTYSILPSTVKYIVNKDTSLWNFATTSWGGFKVVKPLHKGEEFVVYAIADNHNVHAKYGVTEYSYNRKMTNGVNMADLDLAPTPQPIPEPQPIPPTPEQPTPEPAPGQETPIPAPPQDLGWLRAALQAILASIQAIISKLY